MRAAVASGRQLRMGRLALLSLAAAMPLLLLMLASAVAPASASTAAAAAGDEPQWPFPVDAQDLDEIDPRAPADASEQFPSAHIDIEPIAGGVVRLDIKNGKGNGKREPDAACFCQLPERARRLLNSECLVPHRISLYKPQTGANATAAHRELSIPLLKRLIGSVNEVRLVSAAHASFACVDGRQTHLDAPRTFGGDFGELLQALSFVHGRHGTWLSQDDVDWFVADWVDTHRGRGAHEQLLYTTDVQAVARLTQWLRENHGLAGTQSLDITAVPPQLQRAVLDGLLIPAHQGSLPLRLFLEFPARFNVHASVFAMLSEAFFKLLWRRDRAGVDGPLHARLAVIIAEGYHTERVFLEVRNSNQCYSEGIHSVLTLSHVADIAQPGPDSKPPARARAAKPRSQEQVAAEGAAAAAATLKRQQERLARQEAANNAAFLELDLELDAGYSGADAEAEDAAGAGAGAGAGSDFASLDVEDDDAALLLEQDSAADAEADADADYDYEAAEAAEAALLLEQGAGMAAGRPSLSSLSAAARRSIEEREDAAEAAAAGSKAPPAPRPKPVTFPARPAYPWARAGGDFVPGLSYRPTASGAFQAFVFNQQAAMALRRELLTVLLRRMTVSSVPREWTAFAEATIANDRILTSAVAGRLPKYIVYMQ